MSHVACVFKNQRKLFMRDKGMLVFYLTGVFVAGVAVPIFSHSLVSCFLVAAFITTLWVKPMLAESLAGEREKRTLESLLSTPIRGKSVLWGKLLFHLLFTVALFGASAGCAALTYRLAGYTSELALWQWLGVLGMAALNFSAISIAGTYLSATSADMRTANGRVSVAAYPLGLLFIIFISVMALGEPLAALVVGGVAALAYLCVCAVFAAKASAMRQHRYYENVKMRKTRRKNTGGVSYAAPKSQFETVLQHEWRYFKTIKSQIRKFALLCGGTVLCACLVKVSEVLTGTGAFGLGHYEWTVLLTVFGVPFAVINLISYSIGGERAYKTGEALLSTPLRVKTIFLAKCAVPMMIALALIAISSILSLTGVNIIGLAMGSAEAEFYSPTQFVLMVPGTIIACLAMILINGMLSVMMKTPRSGLYMATLVQLVLFVPPAVIIYIKPDNTFLWAVIYTGALALVSVVLLARIAAGISRPWLMGRL